jgi:hypothetical protein
MCKYISFFRMVMIMRDFSRQISLVVNFAKTKYLFEILLHLIADINLRNQIKLNKFNFNPSFLLSFHAPDGTIQHTKIKIFST